MHSFMMTNTSEEISILKYSKERCHKIKLSAALSSTISGTRALLYHLSINVSLNGLSEVMKPLLPLL